MRTVSYTFAKEHLAKTMTKVCEDHLPLIITRPKAEPVVMISLEDFEGIQETHYLLKSRKNAGRLKQSIDEIEAMIAEEK
jgi:antitoxin YefM